MVASAPHRPGLVSVVVPAYNAARGLKRCLDSVLSQTYLEREVIVVDDGSTDSTGEIARGFGDRLELVLQPHRGECAARNEGFRRAAGQYISFVDHDDYWDPAFLETCVRFLERHPEAAAVSTGSAHRSALSSKVRYMPPFLESSSSAAEDVVLENFFEFWARHNHVCAGSVVLRRSVVEDAGGQREDLALSGDLEYWAYLATFGRWAFIPRVLLHVDGTQSAGPGLYEKFYQRYRRCTSVADWEQRITPRLRQEDRPGFEVVRGRVATWYVFAKLYVGRDREAYLEAVAYKDRLEGRYGRLWRAGLMGGAASWKVMAVLLRARVRAQYRRASGGGGSGR